MTVFSILKKSKNSFNLYVILYMTRHLFIFLKRNHQCYGTTITITDEGKNHRD